jgi:hypothetical protein
MPESNPTVGGREPEAGPGPDPGFVGLMGIAGFEITFTDEFVIEII